MDFQLVHVNVCIGLLRRQLGLGQLVRRDVHLGRYSFVLWCPDLILEERVPLLGTDGGALRCLDDSFVAESVLCVLLNSSGLRMLAIFGLFEVES